VHENEVDNGNNLIKILCDKGCRKIALEGWNSGDATFLLRWKGYKQGVEAWNKAHPQDKAVLLDPQYGGTTSDTGRGTAEAIINANHDVDALIVAGGGGDTLVGALAAIDSMGLKGKIKVVSTDFLADLDQQLASGGMAAESGGHYADPLFAFMLVYNAIKGNYHKPAGSFYEVNFPYLYVASSKDYDAYAKYFVADLPYNAKELAAMAKLSEGDLAKKAASLSIQDVMQRRK
jgi:ribose transport system substrate-binding protein